eukprot:3071368-Rhodomonas_salina.3
MGRSGTVAAYAAMRYAVLRSHTVPRQYGTETVRQAGRGPRRYQRAPYPLCLCYVMPGTALLTRYCHSIRPRCSTG